jgi:FSR family fosmidomycin resistance protein-like MFS transporter
MGGGTPLLVLLALTLLVFLRNVGGPQRGTGGLGGKLKAQTRSLRESMKGGAFWGIVPIFAVSALRGMGDRPLVWMIPLYLSKELGESDFTVAFHVALLAAPGIVSGPLFGALSDRIGRKPIIACTMAVGVVLPPIMVLGGVWLTLSVAAFGLFMFTVNSLTQAAALDLVEGRRLEGTFIGLMWGSNAFFGFGSSLAAGLLAESVGRESVFYFASGLFLAGFLVSLAMPSTGGRAGARAQSPTEGS